MKTLAVSNFKRLSAVQLALLALFIAAEIILGYFSFGPAWMKVQFSFVAITIIAQWYGPVWSMTVAFLVDFVSTMLHGSVYFPGFALSAIATMGIFAFAFHNHERLSWVRIAVAVFLQLMIVNALMNTTWVVMLGYIPADMHLIMIRVIKQFIMLPIEVIVIYLVLNNDAMVNLRKQIFNR